MNTILLSNLIKIRWIAIIGQILAILIVYFLLNINILVFECLLITLFSVVINLYTYLLQKKDNKISDKQAFIFLLYDTSQLGFLLYLSGGIFNPFCILIIAPVIISASYLPAFWTIILSCFSIILILSLNNFHIAINWQMPFLIPDLYYGLLTSLAFLNHPHLLLLLGH